MVPAHARLEAGGRSVRRRALSRPWTSAQSDDGGKKADARHHDGTQPYRHASLQIRKLRVESGFGLGESKIHLSGKTIEARVDLGETRFNPLGAQIHLVTHVVESRQYGSKIVLRGERKEILFAGERVGHRSRINRDD
jgi:hypothetical protein